MAIAFAREGADVLVSYLSEDRDAAVDIDIDDLEAPPRSPVVPDLCAAPLAQAGADG